MSKRYISIIISIFLLLFTLQAQAQKKIKKADAVDPKGNILVDDFLGNLDYWHEKGGISIKFSDSGKECIYQTITDLSELLKLKS